MMGIVIAFSVLMEEYANEWFLSQFLSLLNCWAKSEDDSLRENVNVAVCSVIAEVMHHASVTSDMGLVEVGLGSMTTIIVVSELKKVYKIQLSVRDCFDSETVGDLVALIEARLDISELDGGGDLCDLV